MKLDEIFRLNIGFPQKLAANRVKLFVHYYYYLCIIIIFQKIRKKLFDFLLLVRGFPAFKSVHVLVFLKEKWIMNEALCEI